jgi:hypothetical protein
MRLIRMADMWLAYPPCRDAIRKARLSRKAEERIREAILVYVDSLLAHGDSVPTERKSYQGTVTISLADVA